VHLVNDLTETERGDRVIMQLIAELEQDGTAGDNEMEGNEEPMVNDEQEIVIDLFRHSVKNKGKMAEQRTVVRFRAQARNKLAYWLGNKLDEMAFLTTGGRAYTNKLDLSARNAASQLPQLEFAAGVTAPSAGRVMYAGAATSEATLTAADTMTWKLLLRIRAYAATKRIKPVKMNGRDHHAIVMSPQQSRDLKGDSDYMTNVGRAGNQGQQNPLFTGSFAVIDGMILYEHPKTINTQGLASGSKWGAGGTIEGAQATLMGAQGLGFARIGEPAWAELGQRNYGNRQGVGYGRMIGFLKPRFRSIYDGNATEDFGIIAIKTAAAF
jgi:N4-gp56 family major capsid protein